MICQAFVFFIFALAAFLGQIGLGGLVSLIEIPTSFLLLLGCGN